MRARALASFLGISCLAASVHAQPPPATAPPAASSATAAPSASAAPPAPAPSQEDRERANAMMDDGDAKIASGDLAGALASYESAHAIMHVPTTGIEVAKTLDRLGKLLAALAAAREVAAMPATPGEPKPFTEAREQARALAAAIEARVPTLSITVKITTPGVRPEITLDRRPLTADELTSPIALEPGRYRVAASADGHAPTSIEVVLKERDRGQVALVLAPIVEAPPPPTAPPPPPPVTLSPFVPAGFTIAGVGTLAGAITGALALSAANEANNLCPTSVCPSEATRKTAEARYDTADALAVVADVSFALAVAGAAMGIYGIAVTLSPPPASQGAAPSTARKPSPTADLLVGPGNAALRFTF